MCVEREILKEKEKFCARDRSFAIEQPQGRSIRSSDKLVGVLMYYVIYSYMQIMMLMCVGSRKKQPGFVRKKSEL